MKTLARWLLCCLCALGTQAPRAHPIVSTDINRHVTLEASRTGLSIHYIYNMLEVAAVNVGRAADTDADGQVSDAERERYAQLWADELQGALRVTLDDEALPLRLRSVRWELGPAPFGLHTWTLTAELEAAWQARAVASLRYRDTLRPGEVGWKEVILRAREIQLRAADVLATDRSARLTDYQAMADHPNPDQLAAHAQLVFAAEVARSEDRAVAPERGAADPRHLSASKGSAVTRVETAASRPVTLASHASPGAVTSAPVATERPVAAAALDATASETAADSPSTKDEIAFTSAGAWRHYAAPFFRLGMHHIAIGWDHLAFLLGLLLFRQRLGQLACVVTAFTLAHSLTLGLAASGLVNPPGPWVEALIALSIAYVGVMALWKPHFRHGPWLAFGFGLVHGFGFAGALSESLGEVAGQAWLVALAGFNLGIEVFQLMLVVLAYGLLRVMDRMGDSTLPRRALACLVIALGAWWTVERAAAVWPAAVAG